MATDAPTLNPEIKIAAAETLVEQTRECLSEREVDSRLAGDFRAAVATICSDLGLDPDWSRWPEAEVASEVPIIPMLVQFLATAKTPDPPERDEAAMIDGDLRPRESQPPPGT